MRTVVTADWLFDGSGLVAQPVMEIEDGRVAAIWPLAAGAIPKNVTRLELAGTTLAPAFFDVHFHGAAGHDVMEATPEALATIGAFLETRGTGSYLATTVTAPLDSILASLAGLAKLLRQPSMGARPLGIHLEGPFLSHVKRGVHPPEHLLEPDIATFNRMWEAAEGQIRLMTLAPELAGAAELAAYAVAKGVRVSVGHSNATAAETRAVLAVGATSATHTFNAMRVLDHREPGILGTVLATDDLYAELICDGIHVDPALVKVWWRAKGGSRAILITDAMSATGMPEGEYQLGGFAVQVAHGRATANGVLAGSVLTQDKALSNFVAFTGASVAEAVPLLTRNPTAMAGGVSRLAVGDEASFVALAADGSLVASVMRGKRVR